MSLLFLSFHISMYRSLLPRLAICPQHSIGFSYLPAHLPVY